MKISNHFSNPLKLIGMMSLGLWLSSGCPSRAAETLVEAEANPTAGDMKVLDLPEASGGKAVSSGRDWQPLFKGGVPVGGDAFTVWCICFSCYFCGRLLPHRKGCCCWPHCF